jgi:hypothetical protein
MRLRITTASIVLPIVIRCDGPKPKPCPTCGK